VPRPRRVALRLGTLLTAALGGVYIASLLSIVIATPPFNSSLRSIITVGGGGLSITSSTRFRRLASAQLSIRAYAAESVALVPRYRGAGGVALFTLPLWVPLLLLAAPTVVLDRLERRAARARASAPGCAACGYPLAGLPRAVRGGPTCPECGRESLRLAA
jgi:hypothetical protein